MVTLAEILEKNQREITVGRVTLTATELSYLQRTVVRYSTAATTTLQIIKSVEGETVIKDMLAVKVLQTKEPVAYNNQSGSATMKEILIADGTTFSKAIAYDVKKIPLLLENECVLLTNVIKKPDGALIITSQTDIYSTSATLVTVPDAVRQSALEKKVSSVLDASLSPQKSVVTVQGKVVKTAPSCRKRINQTNEAVSFKKLKLKDNSGIVEVGLWRDLAETAINPGDHVCLNNFYVTKRFHKQKNSQIPVLANQKKNSSLQFLPTDYDEISSDASDFEENITSEKIGNVMGIQSVHSYRACINTRCNMRAITNNQCPTCKITYSQTSAGTGYVCKLLIKDDDKFTVFTLFTEATNKFLKSVELTESTERLTEALKEKLPIKVSYVANGNIVNSIQAINKNTLM